ncbi:hypothetical protein PACTADRAFT_32219 [Pachysolen tannophilus NRRL Y-2460]|uniref:Pre-rRNA-processing protein IPI3 n=1 Tax=Pachysolen tannophilus NRRL Y-2460 TaxID=669874 RepID=A0A1E4TY88_PACTA|nr:hypothetical protein PACTADRAFT_32219 [Pachysolen tannophilus NRRL Y-2460]
MDEGVFYISRGDPADKNLNSCFALSSSIHNSKSFQSFRQCCCNRNCFVFINGFQKKDSKLIVACSQRALLHVYSFGKESPDQKFPIPEELTCLTSTNDSSGKPWLLAGGSKSGKVYIWELSSGYLLQVKAIHYQAVSCINFTDNCDFLISGGLDSRIAIYKTFDLINIISNSISNGGSNNDEEEKSIKPYAIFTDHTLPVTDIVLTKGLTNDIKIYSISKDCTIRCYHLITKKILTTFVATSPVESITLDSSERSLYLGFESGLIRQVPLYQVNKINSTLEKIGGNNKIININDDPDLQYTFLNHKGYEVTSLALSLDGTYLISGDSKGRIFISDVITKQVLKNLKELSSGISGIFQFTLDESENSVFAEISLKDKQKNQLPVLKRVLVGEKDLQKHDVYIKLNQNYFETEIEFELKNFINTTANEELVFSNFTNIDSMTKITTSDTDDSSKVKDLEEQLQAMKKGYTELRSIHEDLFSEYSKLLSETKK